MLFTVTVKPRARAPKILRDGNHLTVWVDAPPQDGRANERLRELVAQELGVPRRAVRIRSGHASRRKLVEVDR